MEYNRAVERGIPRLIFLMHRIIRLRRPTLTQAREPPRWRHSRSAPALSYYRKSDLMAFLYVNLAA
jgi:hypothetical protein